MDDQKISLCDISSPALAYLGDSVIEVLVRQALVESGISSSKKLNERALMFVSAPAQAAAVKNIIEELTEEDFDEDFEDYFEKAEEEEKAEEPKEEAKEEAAE